MKQRKFNSLLAVLVAAFGITFLPAAKAWAQDAGSDSPSSVASDDDLDAGTDDGVDAGDAVEFADEEQPVGDDKPKCPDCKEVTDAAVKKCNDDLTSVTTDRDTWKKRAEECESKLNKPTPPPKPLACGEGTKNEGGQCVCEEPDALRFPHYSTWKWVCVLPSSKSARKEIVRQIKLELEYLKSKYSWAAGRIAALQAQVDGLAKSDQGLADGLDSLSQQSIQLAAMLEAQKERMDTIEDALCPPIKDKPDATLQERCRKGSLVVVTAGVEPGVIFRPGAGAGFTLLQSNTLEVHFDRTSPWSIKGKFGWGGHFNDVSGGQNWMLSESLDIGYDINDEVGIEAGGGAHQMFLGADKGAGYDDVVLSPQMAYGVTGEGGLLYRPHKNVELGLKGFAGWCTVNTLPHENAIEVHQGACGGVSLRIAARLGF